MSRKKYYALIFLILGVTFTDSHVKKDPWNRKPWLEEEEEHIRSKRNNVADSNVHYFRVLLGRLARLTNALQLQAHLQNPNTTILTHIGAEFVGLKGSLMESLLSFDEKFLTDYMNGVKTSMSMNKDQILDVNGWLDGKKGRDLNQLKSLFNVTKDTVVVSISSTKWLGNSAKLKESYYTFKNLSKNDGDYATKGNMLIADVKQLLTWLDVSWPMIRDRVMGSNIVSPVRPILQERLQLIEDLLPAKISQAFPLTNTFSRFLNEFDHQKVIQNIRTLNHLNRENLPQFQRDYTGGFLGGPQDFDLFYKDLKDEEFSKFVENQTTWQQMAQNALQPLLGFRERVGEFKSAVLETAVTEEVPETLKVLLRDLEEVEFLRDSWNETLSQVQERYDTSKEPIGSAAGALKKMLQQMEQIEEKLSNDTWRASFVMDFGRVDPKDVVMLMLAGELKGIKTVDEFRNSARIGFLLEQTLETEAFYNNINGVHEVYSLIAYEQELKKLESDLEKVLGEFQNPWQAFRMDVVDRCADLVSNYTDPGFEMDDKTKNYLKEFNEKLKESFDKFMDQIPKPSESKLMTAWKNWDESEVTLTQLVAGVQLFQTFDEALARKTEIQDLIKSYKVVESTVPTISLNAAMAKKLFYPLPTDTEMDQFFQEIAALETDNKAKYDIDSFLRISLNTKNLDVSIATWHRDLDIANRHKLIDYLQVEKAQKLTQKMADLYLDFSSLQSQLYSPSGLFSRIHGFLNDVFKEEEDDENEKEKDEKEEYSTPWILIGCVVGSPLVAWFLVWLVLCVLRRKKPVDKKEETGEKKKAVVSKKSAEKVPVKKAEEFDAFAPDNEYLRSQKEGKTVDKDMIARGKTNGASKEEKVRRLRFRALLEKAAESGPGVEKTIQSIAEGIQKEYILRRGPKRVSKEKADYYTTANESFATPRGRAWAILNHHKLASKELWQKLRRTGVQCLINLDDDLSEYDQPEFCLNIRGFHRMLYTGKVKEQPFSNLDLYQVKHEASGHVIDYWKYADIPYGFAPLELTPMQVLYNWSTGSRGPNGAFSPVVLMNRDADCRLCILPMIDTILYAMETGNTFEDLHAVGKWMALRLCSIDLVTTAQIEFALYVSFKIILDESPEDYEPMYSESKSEFLIALENSWTSAYLRNFKAYRNYFNENDLDDPDNYDNHWYLPTVAKIQKKLKAMVVFWEARKKEEQLRGHPDPMKST